MIDTHCHLYDEVFASDLQAVISRAKSAGMTKIYMPATHSEALSEMLALQKKYPDFLEMMVGLHPIYVKENVDEQLVAVKTFLDKGGFVAVGEIGIDLYREKKFLGAQQTAFKTQIDWATAKNLPINIHCRDAFDETFEILDAEKVCGIFHCFTGNLAQAKKIVSDYGLKLGIGGIVTFKNGGLDTFLREIPLTEIVLETDAPYLSPTPYRGKRNEPAYTALIAEKIAAIYQCDLQTVIQTTTQTALKIFNS